MSMDADIKALANEVAKINPPFLLQPPILPSNSQIPSNASYNRTRGQPLKATIQYHPYRQPLTHNAITQAAAVVQLHAISNYINQPKKHDKKDNNNNNNNNNINNSNAVGPSYTKNIPSSTHNIRNTYNKSTHYNNSYVNNKYRYSSSKYNKYSSSYYNNYNNPDDIGPNRIKKKKLKASHQYQLRHAAKESWVDPTMTDWPENDFRIFCGDLGNEVSDAMLTSAFSKYPSFAKAKVIRDKRTGKSKGYGFVSFLEPHDFIRAFKEMNGKYVGNRPIKLRRSKWKDRMKKVKNFKIRE